MTMVSVSEWHKPQKLYISYMIKHTEKKYKQPTNICSGNWFSSKLFLLFCASFNASLIHAVFHPDLVIAFPLSEFKYWYVWICHNFGMICFKVERRESPLIGITSHAHFFFTASITLDERFLLNACLSCFLKTEFVVRFNSWSKWVIFLDSWLILHPFLITYPLL